MSDFEVGWLQLDSVNNIANYDFIRAYEEKTWQLYNLRYQNSSSSKFPIPGEELSVPLDLVTSGALDGLWNEPFQGRLHPVILGKGTNSENFEWTVHKMVSCQQGNAPLFTNDVQVVNYITSHDVEEYWKERLYNFLNNNQAADKERLAKLAFAWLPA
jgi:hypothetical protein